MPSKRLFRLPTDRDSLPDEIDDELQFHIQERITELVAAGWERSAAESQALREFGDVAAARADLEAHGRRQLGVEHFSRLIAAAWQTAVFAWRGVRRVPVLSGAIVTTFAVAIAANTAMFGIVDRLLLSPPRGVVAAEQVVRLGLTHGHNPRTGEVLSSTGFTYAEYEQLRDVSGFEELAIAGGTTPRTATFGRDESAARVTVAGVSGNYFSLLGVRPARGRLLQTGDDTAPFGSAVAVISDALWRDRFDAADVTGRTIVIDTTQFTIVGVAPPGFIGLNLEATDVWIPSLAFFGAYQMSAERSADAANRYFNLQLIARMRSGVTQQSAQAEADAVHARVSRRGPQSRLALASLVPGRDDAVFLPPHARLSVEVAVWLMAVALIVLVVAAANVANLLLARASTRGREFGVRIALGAARSQIAGLVDAECVLLALLGAAAGVVLAWLSSDVIRAVLLPGVSWQRDIFDARMIGVTCALITACALIAGTSPALLARRAAPAVLLGASGRHSTMRRSRMRATLVLVQAGGSAVLMIGACLFIVSLRNATHVPLGIDAQQLLYVQYDFRISLSLGDYNNEGHVRDAMQTIASTPGVEHAAIASNVPWKDSRATVFLRREDDAVDTPPRAAAVTFVSPGYFETTGARVVRGRTFNEVERTSAAMGQAVMLSERAARVLWPDGDAIGRCVHRSYVRTMQPGAPCSRVVGIVADTRQMSVVGEPTPLVYEPLLPGHLSTIVVRTRGEASAAVAAIRARLLAEQPTAGVPEITTVFSLIEPQLRAWRLGATLFSLFGGIALALAALGLHSVIAFEVAQQRRDVGVRLALGATHAAVVRFILRGAASLATLGVITGVAVAAVLAPRVQPLLFNVSARDPRIFALVAAVLVTIALAASLAPSLRALRISPRTALEAE